MLSSIEHIMCLLWAKSQEPSSEIEMHEIQSLMRKSVLDGGVTRMLGKKDMW